MRADRLVATLLILQAKGRVTARQLATELEVSEKTARRDLEALGMAGIPVYAQAGRNGGWQLLGGSKTDLSGLTSTEARTLFLAAGASASLTADTSSALRKLVRALPETFRADAEAAASAVVVDPTAWGSVTAPVRPEFLDDLQQAVIERRRTVLGYIDRARAVTERFVDPLGLVSKGTVWYLLAHTDHGLRTFRVGRVRSVELTEVVVERPADFDLGEAWRSVSAAVGERRIRVRATIRVHASRIPGLRGQFGEDMILAEVDAPGPDGREQVIVGGPTTMIIAQHLAGWGGMIEVIDPPEVRAHLARIAGELTAVYNDQSAGPVEPSAAGDGGPADRERPV
jgi:predicted DNA-binding transcriptional regulator YafY